MQKHHLALLALLLTAFTVFAIVSAFEPPVVAGHTMKTAGIYDALTAPVQEEEEMPADTAACDSVVPDIQFPVPVDTTAQTILFIGDSMLEGLGPRLAAYAEKNGHKLYNVIWYSSTSLQWGTSDKLSHYIGTVKPTYIFICLGANELFVKDIKTKRRGYVQKMVSDIDTIPYLWIGPPNWKEDTGINEIIAEETAPGTFFLSDGMEFERSRDGAHPTRTSASLWMDSVARWMPEHSAHPIMMELPDRQSGRPARVFVHQPNEQ